MNLYLLKRDHQEGQDIYGVYESKEKALEQLPQLKEWMPYVPDSHYIVKEIKLNDLVEIEAYEN